MSAFAFFGPGNVMLGVPAERETYMRGWSAVRDAYEHAAWEEAWRALTGRSWADWLTERDRYKRPPAAHFTIDMDPDRPYASTVEVTGGLVAVRRLRADAKARSAGWVTITVPMACTTINTRA